jgi:DNA-binding PadR family transcriptional regulator
MGKVETDIIILGHFLQGPAHGYELKRRIDRSFGNFYIKIINSLLYPRLAQFENDGLIEGKRELQDKVPDKKVYHLTESGKKKLRELVATPVKPRGGVLLDPTDFTVHAIFFSLLTKEERLNVIRPYYDNYKAHLEKGRYALEYYGPHMDGFSKTMTEYGVKIMEENLAVFEKLMNMD